MVSKSYEVNSECPQIIDDDEKCVKSASKMQDADQMTRFDRYILHISNEMVSGRSSPKSEWKEDVARRYKRGGE